MSALEHQGCALAYQVRGQGPPVALIQGVSAQGDAWSPQVTELGRDFACLTFDNRGLGASQPAGAAISVAQLAADTLALLDELGWDSAHLVGHSLGGVVAQELALGARQRVRSLALLNTFARGAEATRLTARMLWLGLRTRVGTRPMRRRAFLEIVLPPAALAREDPDALAARLAGLFGHDLALQPPIVDAQLAALSAWDGRGRLQELGGLPTLVVSAAFDPISRPDSSAALVAGIPGARRVDLPDASHGAPISHAAQVNALLREHLLGAERARG